jgi:nicotinate-nucleotide adenylyltransferase
MDAKQNTELCRQPRRVGILGGSFDPPHNGHLALAKHAAGALALDVVVFVPAAESPLKGRRLEAPAPVRLAMLAAAIASEKSTTPAASPAPAFSICDWEIERGGISYSFYTAQHLHNVFAGDELFWIIGGDQLQKLPDWHRIEDLARLVTFAVAPRAPATPPAPPPALPATVRWVAMPEFFLDINSTRLREALPAARRGDKDAAAILERDLPAGVRELIEREHLY